MVYQYISIISSILNGVAHVRLIAGVGETEGRSGLCPSLNRWLRSVEAQSRSKGAR